MKTAPSTGILCYEWPEKNYIAVLPAEKPSTPEKTYEYAVFLGSGKRTVFAKDQLDAMAKATGCDPSRFERTGPGQYTDVKSSPGHRCTYAARLSGS